MVSYDSLCLYWKWPASIRRCQFVSVLMAGFLLHLSLGLIYTYGNMVPYMVSYARFRSRPEDLRYADSPYVFACQATGLGIGILIGGISEKRAGPRLLSLVGGSIMSTGVALSYFAIRYSFWLLTITFGLMCGVGTGMAYIAPIACSMKWLPKWKGVAAGVVVSGYGLSSLLFTIIQTTFINPYNYSTDYSSGNEKYFSQSSLLDRVPYVFLVLAAICFTFQVLSCIFLVNPSPDDDYTPLPDNDLKREPPKTNGRLNLNYQYSRNDSMPAETSTQFDNINQSTYISLRASRAMSLTSSQTSEVSAHSWTSNLIYNVTPLKMVTKLNFYLLWVMFLSAGTGVAFVSSLYKSFGQTFIDNDHFLMGAGGTSALFNLFGRLAWGVLADMSTYKFALTVQSAAMCCLMGTFYCTSFVGESLFFVWLCALFFCIGGYFSLFPTAVSREFGQEHVSVNYAILFSAHITGTILSAFLAQRLLDKVHWEGLFYVVTGMLLLKYIIILFYRHKRYIYLKHPKDLLESASKQEPLSIQFPINK